LVYLQNEFSRCCSSSCFDSYLDTQERQKNCKVYYVKTNDLQLGGTGKSNSYLVFGKHLLHSRI